MTHSTKKKILLLGLVGPSAIAAMAATGCATDVSGEEDSAQAGSTSEAYSSCEVKCNYSCKADWSATTYMTTGSNTGDGKDCLVVLGTCQGGFPYYNYANWQLDSRTTTCK